MRINSHLRSVREAASNAQTLGIVRTFFPSVAAVARPVVPTRFVHQVIRIDTRVVVAAMRRLVVKNFDAQQLEEGECSGAVVRELISHGLFNIMQSEEGVEVENSAVLFSRIEPKQRAHATTSIRRFWNPTAGFFVFITDRVELLSEFENKRRFLILFTRKENWFEGIAVDLILVLVFVVDFEVSSFIGIKNERITDVIDTPSVNKSRSQTLRKVSAHCSAARVASLVVLLGLVHHVGRIDAGLVVAEVRRLEAVPLES